MKIRKQQERDKLQQILAQEEKLGEQENMYRTGKNN